MRTLSSGRPRRVRGRLRLVVPPGSPTLLWTISTAARGRKRAATSRSIAIAASPQRSMRCAISRLRRSSAVARERRAEVPDDLRAGAGGRRTPPAVAASRSGGRSGSVCAQEPRKLGDVRAGAQRARGRDRASEDPRRGCPTRARRSPEARVGRSAPRLREQLGRRAGRRVDVRLEARVERRGSAPRGSRGRRRAAGGGARTGWASGRSPQERRVDAPATSGARSPARRTVVPRAPRSVAERLAALGVAEQRLDRVRQRLRAPVVHEDAGLVREDDPAAGLRAGGDHGHAGGRRLDHWAPELGAARGRDDDVARPVDAGRSCE